MIFHQRLAEVFGLGALALRQLARLNLIHIADGGLFDEIFGRGRRAREPIDPVVSPIDCAIAGATSRRPDAIK
jgi:hypothetical protein